MGKCDLEFKLPIEHEMLTVKFRSEKIRHSIEEQFQITQFAMFDSYIAFTISRTVKL